MTTRSHWLVILELALITVLGVLYIRQFMPPTADSGFIGIEHERLAGVILPAEIGLKDYGQIPTWNSYIGYGEPLLNNPFNYLFNPFASVPILLWGGVIGSKVAVSLGLLIAGYSMWGFARSLGLGTVARVTAGALYMMSGGIAGKFVPGHFQLGLSLTWIPLVLAGLWWTLHSRDRRAPVLMAVAFALLFFAGNIYYTLHTMICAAVIVLFHLFDLNTGWNLRLDRLRRVALGGIFALGLAMVQFLPVWSIQTSIEHASDPKLVSRYGLDQVVDNFTLNWEHWLLYMPNSRWPAVEYTYLGHTPFLLLGIGLVAALMIKSVRQRLTQRITWIALILSGFMIIWGMGQTAVLQYLYLNIPLLAQFRFVGRAHSIAALWLIILAALVVDALWRAAREMLQSRSDSRRFDRWRLVRTVVLGTLLWCPWVLLDMANRATLNTLTKNPLSGLDNYRFGVKAWRDLLPYLPLVILAVVLVDTLRLLGVFPWWRRNRVPFHAIGFGVLGTRLLRMGILALSLAAILDVMQVNSLLFNIGPRTAGYDSLYAYVEAHDKDPVPMIYAPNTEGLAFEMVYHDARYWGLNEGWSPLALPGMNFKGWLPLEPAWLMVVNDDSPVTEGREYVYQQCLNEWARQNPDADCDVYGEFPIALYHEPDALPYTFLIPIETLAESEGEVSKDKVKPVNQVNHTQDALTVIARTPNAQPGYMLVIQEIHFPGWLAYVDNVPTQAVSIGSFIGIPMLTGIHTYSLRYQPPGFSTGVVVGLLTVIAIWLYLRRIPMIAKQVGSENHRPPVG